MLEIARFWASIAHFNPERERYEIHGVMGPDEFHEKYPDEPEGGLRNNAYTNVMVAWLCDIVGKLPSLLPASSIEGLRARLGIRDNELTLWQDMSRRMFVPFHGDGIISQFEGYDDLEELDWDAYRAKYGNIQRLDRILRAEGRDPNRYKITKQADTVMLFFLFYRGNYARSSGGWDTTTIPTRLRGTSRTTTAGRHTARLSALSPTPGCSPLSTRRAPGTGFLSRSTAMSTTSRAVRPRKGSTWVSWPGRLTSCSGITRAPRSATRFCTSTPGSRAPSAACPSLCSSAIPRSWSRSPATGSRSPFIPRAGATRAGLGYPGDVRESCPGDQASFLLERGPA